MNGSTVRQPCRGSASAIPVPAGMTPEQVWDEITTLGRLHRKPSDEGLTWAVVECPGGGDCRCQFVGRWRSWRRYHNDRLVEAHVLGRRAPQWLLPLLNAWLAVRRKQGR